MIEAKVAQTLSMAEVKSLARADRNHETLILMKAGGSQKAEGHPKWS